MTRELDGEIVHHEDASHIPDIVHYERINTKSTQAVQLTWKTWNDVCEFLGPDVINAQTPGRFSDNPSDTCGETGPYIELDVVTAHGDIATVRHGDWILPEDKPGRFYPVKPDVFAVTYRKVI